MVSARWSVTGLRIGQARTTVDQACGFAYRCGLCLGSPRGSPATTTRLWWVNAEQADRIGAQAEFVAPRGLVDPRSSPRWMRCAYCRSLGRWLVVLDNAAIWMRRSGGTGPSPCARGAGVPTVRRWGRRGGVVDGVWADAVHGGGGPGWESP